MSAPQAAAQHGDAGGLAKINARLLRLAPLMVWHEHLYKPLPAIKTSLTDATFTGSLKSDKNKTHGGAALSSPNSKQSAKGFNLNFKRRGKGEPGGTEAQPADAVEPSPSQQQVTTTQQQQHLGADQQHIDGALEQADLQVETAQSGPHASQGGTPKQEEEGGSGCDESGARCDSPEPACQPASTGSTNQGVGSPSTVEEESQQQQQQQRRGRATESPSPAVLTAQGPADKPHLLREEQPTSSGSEGPPVFHAQSPQDDGHNGQPGTAPAGQAPQASDCAVESSPVPADSAARHIKVTPASRGLNAVNSMPPSPSSTHQKDDVAGGADAAVSPTKLVPALQQPAASAGRQQTSGMEEGQLASCIAGTRDATNTAAAPVAGAQEAEQSAGQCRLTSNSEGELKAQTSPSAAAPLISHDGFLAPNARQQDGTGLKPLASVRSEASMRPQNSMLPQGSLEPGELALTNSTRLLMQGRQKSDAGMLQAESSQQPEGSEHQPASQQPAAAEPADSGKQDSGRLQDSRHYQSSKAAKEPSVRASPSRARNRSRSCSRTVPKQGRHRSRGRSCSRDRSRPGSRSRSRSRARSDRSGRSRSVARSSPSSSSTDRSYSRSRSRDSRPLTKRPSHLSSRGHSPSNSGVAPRLQTRKSWQRSPSPRAGYRRGRDYDSHRDRRRSRSYDRNDNRHRGRDDSRDQDEDYSNGRNRDRDRGQNRDYDRDRERKSDRYQSRGADHHGKQWDRDRGREWERGRAGKDRRDAHQRRAGKRDRSLSQDSFSRGSGGARHGASHGGNRNAYDGRKKRHRSRSTSRSSERSRKRGRRSSRSPSSVSSADNAAHVSAAADADASPPHYSQHKDSGGVGGVAGKAEAGKAGAAPAASQAASGSDMEIESEEGQAVNSPRKATGSQAAGKQSSRAAQASPSKQGQGAGSDRHHVDARDRSHGGSTHFIHRRAKACLAPCFLLDLSDADVKAIERGTYKEESTDLAAYKRSMAKAAEKSRASDKAAERADKRDSMPANNSARAAPRDAVDRDGERRPSTDAPPPSKIGSAAEQPHGTKGPSVSSTGAADEAADGMVKARPQSPSSSLRHSHADQQVLRNRAGSGRPEVEDEPAPVVDTSGMQLLANGGTPVLRSKCAGPNEAAAPPTDALDDLPFLAFSMMKFSSTLMLGCAPDLCMPLSHASFDPTSMLNGSSSSSSSSGYLHQAMQRIGRPYRKDLVKQLAEEARELKGKGDRMFKIASSRWSALPLLKYLESSLMFMEAAYGNEQSTDRERGTADAIQLLQVLTQTTPTNGMLRVVEQQSQALIAKKRAALRNMAEQAASKDGGRRLGLGEEQALQAVQAELVALQALSLLSQQLVAVALTKLLMLQKDSLVNAANALDPDGEGRGLLAGAGGVGTAANKPPARPSHANGNPQGGAGGVGAKGGAGGGAAAGSSPPPADSASSTLEAASTMSSTTWMSSLSTLSTCMRQFAAVGQLWQSAAAGARKMYQDTCVLAAGGYLPDAAAAAGKHESSTSTQDSKPSGTADKAGAARAGDMTAADTSSGSETATAPSWTQQAHIAAAQLMSIGYEWGVWDLLGTITSARQVLDTVLQLPGVVP